MVEWIAQWHLAHWCPGHWQNNGHVMSGALVYWYKWRNSMMVRYISYNIIPWLQDNPTHSDVNRTWWRHQMETLFALLAICAGNSPVIGEFPAQRPVSRIFDVFFDLRLNKRLSKQWWDWWFETPLCPLWRHCNDMGKNVRYLATTKHTKVQTLWHHGAAANGCSELLRLNVEWHWVFSICCDQMSHHPWLCSIAKIGQTNYASRIPYN